MFRKVTAGLLVILFMIIMEQQVIDTIKKNFPQMFQQQVGSFTSLQPSTETHNGVNSPKIKSTDLIPYPISVSGSTTNTGITKTSSGTINFYQYSGVLADWGFNVALGGIWNPFTIVPSAMGATQTTAQTLSTGTTTSVIFDSITYDLYPAPTATGTGTVTVSASGTSIVGVGTSFKSLFVVGDSIVINNQINQISVITDNTHMTVTNPWVKAGSGVIFLYYVNEYSGVDGEFSPYTAGNYYISAGVSFTNASHSGEVVLQIVTQVGAGAVVPQMTKSIYVPTAATTVTAEISGIVQLQGGQNESMWIEIKQSTGANQTTLLNDNTWLNIQKMK